MSSSQPEQQHYGIHLTLTREFLKWTHTHRLLEGQGDFQNELWAKQPSEKQFLFEGKYGTQFSNFEELRSFSTAFNALLERHKIDDKHTNPLLYLISFLNRDYEWQSIIRNKHNHLHDYAKFIIELIADSEAHIRHMRKNSVYKEVIDPFTGEFFFAKYEVANLMSLKELAEYLPDADHLEDVVRYQRISLYNKELYIADDLAINLSSIDGRTIVSPTGEQKNANITLPKTLRYEVLTYIIKHMLDEHKKHKTDFYEQLGKEVYRLEDLKVYIEKHNKKNILSPNKSIAIVGTLVGDYLMSQRLYTTKRSIAKFLFEYFALFKAITLKRPVPFPDDYSELIPFYIKNRVNGETIRNRMKDVGEI